MSVLDKAIIIPLMTMIMHKVGLIMVIEKHDVYNCELSYILKLICTIQLLLLVSVGNDIIPMILKKDTLSKLFYTDKSSAK